jgi:hypothetical protein
LFILTLAVILAGCGSKTQTFYEEGEENKAISGDYTEQATTVVSEGLPGTNAANTMKLLSTVLTGITLYDAEAVPDTNRVSYHMYYGEKTDGTHVIVQADKDTGEIAYLNVYLDAGDISKQDTVVKIISSIGYEDVSYDDYYAFFSKEYNDTQVFGSSIASYSYNMTAFEYTIKSCGI